MVRWINGRARCVEPDDGTGLKLFGVSMDVTARKQAEASARGSPEEAGRAGARRTRGHPWRAHRNPGARSSQPLAAILANSSAVGSISSTHLNPTFRRCAARSPTSARSPNGPPKSFVGCATCSSATRRASPTSISISSSATSIASSTATLSPTGSPSTSTCRPGVLPVKADNVQLQQVMLNLMLNAFSAMSGAQLNGARRLIVRTKSIDASNVLVELQDSGTGIAPEKLESIFDPFITSKPRRPGDRACDQSHHRRTPRRQSLGCQQSRPRRDVLDHAAGHPRVNLTVRHFAGEVKSTFVGPARCGRVRVALGAEVWLRTSKNVDVYGRT